MKKTGCNQILIRRFGLFAFELWWRWCQRFGSRDYHMRRLLIILLALSSLGVWSCSTGAESTHTIPDRYNAALADNPYPSFKINTTPTQITVKQIIKPKVQGSSDQTRPVKLYAARTPDEDDRRYFLMTDNIATAYVMYEFGKDKQHSSDKMIKYMNSFIDLLKRDCYNSRIPIEWESRDWKTCFERGSIKDKTNNSLKIERKKPSTYTPDDPEIEYKIILIDYRSHRLIRSKDVHEILLNYEEFGEFVTILNELVKVDMLEDI